MDFINKNALTSSLTNLPGLSDLAYRAVKYEDYLPILLDNIIYQSVPEGKFVGKKPLLQLQTNSSNAVTVLLDSWAIMTDIISFYQERILNEGYIRTCKQSLSHHQILKLFGKHIHPGITSSGMLALTLKPEFSGQQFTIPSGIQVQNIPSPGVKSQTFESHTDLLADAAFNTWQPLTTKIQTISTASNQLFIKKINSSIKLGDNILLVNNERIKNNKNTDWNNGAVVNIHTMPKQNCTQIDLALERTESSTTSSAINYKTYHFQKSTRLFGSRAPVFKYVSPEMKRKLSIISSSFHLYEPIKNTWSPCGQGLQNPIAHQFWFAAKHFHYAVTSQGLFRTTNFKVWVPTQNGINTQKIYYIHSIYDEEHQNDLLFLGTDIGLFYSNDYGSHWTLRSDGISNNHVISINHIGKTIYAGTRKGLFYSTDFGEKWHQAAGLHEHTIYSLVTDNHKHLFVGTEQGVVRTRGHAHGWEVWRHGIEKEVVTALSWHDNKLFAATTNGIYRSMKAGKDWHFINKGLPNVPVLDLLSDPKGNIYVATQQGLYCSTDYGDDWFSYGFNNTTVTTAAYTPEGLLLASVYYTEQPKQWPNFAIVNNQIDLESFEPKILKNSWLLLKNKQHRLLTQVKQIEHLVRKDFMLTSTITRITPDVEIDANVFNLNDTLVFLLSKPLALSEVIISETISGQSITLANKISTLPLPRKIMLQGTAVEQTNTSAEIATVIDIDNTQDTTCLKLKKPLDNQYQRDTTIIYGNILPIIQGETTLEVLNTKLLSKKTDVKFNLRKAPLAYRQDDSPQGYHNMLDIFINDFAWRQVSNLYHQKPGDLVYMLEANHKGKAKIIFGNGVHGSTIPTGINNIKALYTVMSEEAVKIPENHITILKRNLAPRPNEKNSLAINQKLDIPIQKVTNPLAINNRVKVKATVKPKDAVANVRQFTKRAISIKDIINTACQHSGVDKAIAIQAWNTENNQQVIYLTIATKKQYDAIFFQNTTVSLQKALISNLPLFIKSYTPVYFSVSLTLKLSDQIDDQAEVIARCHTLLEKTFNFDNASLSQTIYAGEIILKLQQIKEIIAVQLSAFHFTEQTPTIQTALTAQAMLTTKTDFIPAELLLLSPKHTHIVVQE